MVRGTEDASIQICPFYPSPRLHFPSAPLTPAAFTLHYHPLHSTSEESTIPQPSGVTTPAAFHNDRQSEKCVKGDERKEGKGPG